MKSFGEALSDKKLKDSTFRLYCCIWKSMEVNNKPFIKTNTEITDYTGMSESTITRALKQLIDLGYVTVSKGQKVNIDGQIRILNDESYRTLNVTDKVEVKKDKKVLNWKEDEKFVSFYNRYREAIKSQGRPMNTNQKNAYKLYVKIKNKEELFSNTNEYCRQMRETNTYLKDLSTWLNVKNELWINDDYVSRPVMKQVDYKSKREEQAQKHYKEYITLVDVNTREEKAELYARILKHHNQGTPYVIEEEIIKLINN